MQVVFPMINICIHCQECSPQGISPNSVALIISYQFKADSVVKPIREGVKKIYFIGDMSTVIYLFLDIPPPLFPIVQCRP